MGNRVDPVRNVFFVLLFVRVLRMVLDVLADSHHLLLKLLYQFFRLILIAHLNQILELFNRLKLGVYG